MTGVYLYADLEYTDNFLGKLSARTETVENEYYSSAPPCEDNEIIAINNKSGEEFTKNQLVGEKLLIPYTYNGQEVLFYGQYNENNNWDQDCIINVYENDKLVLISETEYNNGIPSFSKQVFPSITKEKINVWSITDREYNENYSNGETWNYFKVNECTKSFKLEDVKIEDILYVSQFENNMKTFSLLEGYYKGKIRDSTYNDEDKNEDNDGNNNKSYMIKYDENGYIRTFYIGDFKDGDFNDQTGEAIEIVFDTYNNINKYFKYEGTFTDGERDTDVPPDSYIDQDEINDIIKDLNIDSLLLNWYITK